MVQATLGAGIGVRTIARRGEDAIPPGTQSGTDFRLDKKGVPHLKGSGRGAHIVRVIVRTPTKLSGQQKKLMEEFASPANRRGYSLLRRPFLQDNRLVRKLVCRGSLAQLVRAQAF